jgi:hypothetical protein
MRETPMTTSGRSWLLLALLFVGGLILGGGIASGVFLYLMHEQQLEHETALAALGVADNFNPLRGGSSPKAHREEEAVKEIGKGFVADLEKNRLASAYRTTTGKYQGKIPRKEFDALVAKYPALRNLDSSTFSREYKASKMAGGTQYGFYFTGRVNSARNELLNVALILVQVDGDWRVDDVEVAIEGEKKGN